MIYTLTWSPVKNILGGHKETRSQPLGQMRYPGTMQSLIKWRKGENLVEKIPPKREKKM